MYVKIVGGLFLIGSAAAMGCLKSEELEDRVKRLREFKQMILMLQGELRFHRGTLAEAFGNVATRTKGTMKRFLEQIAERLESKEGQGFEELWNKEAQILLSQKEFYRQDERLFFVLGNGLGYLDLTMQMETIELVLLQTEETIRSAVEEKERKGKLYRTMGVTVGAMLTLLII